MQINPVTFWCVAGLLCGAVSHELAAAQSPELPRVMIGNDGQGEVIFRSNCVVYYNADGSRREANRNCTRLQRAIADETMERYRNDQGMFIPGRPGSSQPLTIVDGPGGSFTVFMPGNCIAAYDRVGTRSSATQACDRSILADSDAAAARYSSGQGGVNPGIPRPPGGGFTRPVSLNDLLRTPRDDAEREIARRGFVQISSERTDSRGRFTIYWREPSQQCVSVNTRSGSVYRINATNRRNCR